MGLYGFCVEISPGKTLQISIYSFRGSFPVKMPPTEAPKTPLHWAFPCDIIDGPYFMYFNLMGEKQSPEEMQSKSTFLLVIGLSAY
jgi:hypothetical protein